MNDGMLYENHLALEMFDRMDSIDWFSKTFFILSLTCLLQIENKIQYLICIKTKVQIS